MAAKGIVGAVVTLRGNRGYPCSDATQSAGDGQDGDMSLSMGHIRQRVCVKTDKAQIQPASELAVW